MQLGNSKDVTENRYITPTNRLTNQIHDTSRTLIWQSMLIQQVMKFTAFMTPKPKCSLPCSPKPAIWPYPKPVQYSLHSQPTSILILSAQVSQVASFLQAFRTQFYMHFSFPCACCMSVHLIFDLIVVQYWAKNKNYVISSSHNFLKSFVMIQFEITFINSHAPSPIMTRTPRTRTIYKTWLLDMKAHFQENGRNKWSIFRYLTMLFQLPRL